MASTERIIRVITRASDGSIREREFENFDEISGQHDQIGIDDCSTDLDLRGMPIFRGLVGPLPEGKTAVRYESPDIFETLTKEWTLQKTKRRRRRKVSETANADTQPNALMPNMKLRGVNNSTMPSAS